MSGLLSLQALVITICCILYCLINEDIAYDIFQRLGTKALETVCRLAGSGDQDHSLLTNSRCKLVDGLLLTQETVLILYFLTRI